MNKKMNVKAYLKDVHNELVNKTSWPTWSELTNSAIVVMVASVIIATVIFAMDFSFETTLKWVYGKLY
jgi:preprotein translocase subunit SecE